LRFWDSSALVPLLIGERTTSMITAEFERDPAMIVWWATEIECISALARLERDGHLTGSNLGAAVERLTAAAAAWAEVEPVARVRQTAIRLLRVHPLRAADSMQLAAAIVAAEGDPRSLPFLTLDERLATAAEREGFPVIGLV
jgi:predicted nucleic acid-binding protein